MIRKTKGKKTHCFLKNISLNSMLGVRVNKTHSLFSGGHILHRTETCKKIIRMCLTGGVMEV